MFLKTFNHKLDSKGRISLPASFRKAAANDSMLLVMHPEKPALRGFLLSRFSQAMLEVVGPMSEVPNVDKEGRFSLSPEFSKYIFGDRPKPDVVFTGHGEYFMLQADTVWRKSLDQDFLNRYQDLFLGKS